MKIKFLDVTVLILIVTIGIMLTNWRIRDKLFEIKYDFLNNNKEIHTKKEIDLILKEIKKVKYSDLEERYLRYTKSNKKKYQEILKKVTFFEIERKDLNRRIAGRFRLKDFMCKDNYYKNCILQHEEKLICAFNPKVFYKTIELLGELEKLGYNKNGFEIVNGHRHPSYNEKIGGASLSRHIKGEAVDIRVNDINLDNKINKLDKDIILDLLENKIIKDEGGIGLYPGTKNVHYDVRGVKARWNSF